MNEELAELVGAFIGDGFYNVYNDSHNHMEFVGHKKFDKQYLRYLATISEKYFRINPIFKFHSGALRLIIHSKVMNTFFLNLNLPMGKKSDIIEIPQDLYNSKYITNVIRGIFDTDGFVYLDKRKIYKQLYPRIGITTKSKKLFLQLKQVIQSLGFNVYCRREKRNDIYHLEIYGYKQMDKWMRTIGSSNKKHLSKIALVAQLEER